MNAVDAMLLNEQVTKLIKPQRLIKYLRICAPSEDSDQPAYSHNLIGIITGRILDIQ